jgi:hypothetical protein
MKQEQTDAMEWAYELFQNGARMQGWVYNKQQERAAFEFAYAAALEAGKAVDENGLVVLRYELVAENDELPGPYVRQVTLDRVRQSDGTDKWAIRTSSSCLNKSGEFVYEPMPSSRSDEFIKDTRFDSEQEAITAWNRRTGDAG